MGGGRGVRESEVEGGVRLGGAREVRMEVRMEVSMEGAREGARDRAREGVSKGGSEGGRERMKGRYRHDDPRRACLATLHALYHIYAHKHALTHIHTHTHTHSHFHPPNPSDPYRPQLLPPVQDPAGQHEHDRELQRCRRGVRP